MKTWMITGGTGFLGQALCNQLEAIQSLRIISVVRTGSGIARSRAIVETGSFASSEFWKHLLLTYQPEVLINAAGKTPPADRESLWDANHDWLLSLFQGIDECNSPVRLIHTGSAAELGEVPERDLPVSENFRAQPVNDYGRSKWAATQLILNHAEAHQRRHVVARVFNLCGPGQGQKQALGRYTAELASATGTEEILLYAFALDYKRDFLDVRDAARAIIQLADSNTAAGLYHLGRGSSHSIRESLNCLIQYSGHKVTIIEEPPANPMREGVRDSVANITRISHETGWSPEIRFEDSLRDLWADVSSRS